jgi:hypothetical protein
LRFSSCSRGAPPARRSRGDGALPFAL